MEQLLAKNPEVAAAGLARAHFTLEFRAAMNLLGTLDRPSESGILETLKHAENRDLAEFCAARRLGGTVSIEGTRTALLPTVEAHQ